uniref:MmgE/PrpD family protein n=1 Tax=Polynucleobacter necessarius subsp. necessarius (strain STIR1) TaxID=452638 RepID=B1XVR9_POLNS
MSHAIAAAADLNAPPVTKILAEFVNSHPSKGWTPEVEHEAHRTFLNWLGCAIGAANHESVESSLAAIREFQPAPQASILGRKDKVDMGGAALINGISSHIRL